MQPGAVLNASDIIAQTAMAVTICKGLVDLLRMCWGGDRQKQPPHWVPPVAAMILGPVIIALLNLTVHADLTDPSTVGKVLLAGFMTTLSAIGVTELHNQATPLPSAPFVPSQPLQNPGTVPVSVPSFQIPPVGPNVGIPPWQQHS